MKEINETVLRKCPFCGNKQVYAFSEGYGIIRTYVKCEECSAVHHIRHWNNRCRDPWPLGLVTKWGIHGFKAALISKTSLSKENNKLKNDNKNLTIAWEELNLKMLELLDKMDEAKEKVHGKR